MLKKNFFLIFFIFISEICSSEIILKDSNLKEHKFKKISELNRFITNKDNYTLNFLDHMQFDETLKITNSNNIFLNGNNKLLTFNNIIINSKLIYDVNEGDQIIYVNNPNHLIIGQEYIIYPNKKDDRLLEFKIIDIIENIIKIDKPVRFMSHVKHIPVNSPIIKRENFIEIVNSNNITIENLIFDGQNKGQYLGHINYCAILYAGAKSIANDVNIKDINKNLIIKNNHFINLNGRGVAFYNLIDAKVNNNFFFNIKQEALEVDHFSSGIINNNFFLNNRVAIQLNDAFNTLVFKNFLLNNTININIIKHFPDKLISNTDLEIEDNQIINNK